MSKVGRSFAKGHRAVASLVTLALSAMVASSLVIYPHSLSYFNELAGGPRQGAKYLLNSNLDWGQDLFYLERWCAAHPEARPLEVVYDGLYPLERTEIPASQRITAEGGPVVRGEGMGPGWYAVSLNELYGQSEQYREFLTFQPVAMAGYSIAIYHIPSDQTTRDLQTASGQPMP